MRPGADSKVNRRCSPLISNNPFSVLSDEKLFSLSLSPLTKSYKKRQTRKKCMLNSLFISAISIFNSPFDLDLGSEEPLTLSIMVTRDHPATLLMDCGARSQ